MAFNVHNTHLLHCGLPIGAYTVMATIGSSGWANNWQQLPLLESQLHHIRALPGATTHITWCKSVDTAVDHWDKITYSVVVGGGGEPVSWLDGIHSNDCQYCQSP